MLNIVANMEFITRTEIIILTEKWRKHFQSYMHITNHIIFMIKWGTIRKLTIKHIMMGTVTIFTMELTGTIKILLLI